MTDFELREAMLDAACKAIDYAIPVGMVEDALAAALVVGIRSGALVAHVTPIDAGEPASEQMHAK